MDSKLLKICLVACMAVAVNACDKGDYNDLSCESDYQSECLSREVYMACINGQLDTVKCEPNAYCSESEVNGIRTASCVNYGQGNNGNNKCGNGTIDAGEACELSNLNGKTCSDLIADSVGELSCNTNCQFDTSGCKPVSEAKLCGDGVISASEDCENGIQIDKTCNDIVPGSEGTLACNTKTCYFDVTGCKEVVKVETECENNSDCASADATAICSHGVCITAEMENIEENESCDPYTFKEFCKDDKMVYCGRQKNAEGEYIEDEYGDYVYGVIMGDCSDFGGCGIVDMKDAYGLSQPVLEAWCVNSTLHMSNEEAAAICTDVGKFPICADLSPLGYDFSAESYAYCMKNSDGGFNVLDGYTFDEYIFCEDEDGNIDVCADSQHCAVTEDFYCSFDYKCEDSDTISFCDDSWYIETGTVKCSDFIENSVCANVEGMDYCFVPCDKLGATRSECEVDEDYGDSSYVTYVCSKGRDGNLYEVPSYEYCNNDCSDTDGCVKYSDEEGSECDPDEYKTHCENNAVIGCSSLFGEVVSRACGEMKCVEDAKIGVDCLETCGVADTEYSVCDDSWGAYGFFILDTYECTQVGDNYYYVFSNEDFCDNGCNATNDGCLKLIDDEGESCDNPGEYIECREDILVACELNGKKTAIDCGEYGYLCKDSAKLGQSYCVDPNNRCKSESEPTTYCEYSDRYGTNDTYVKVCENIDGVIYNINFWQEECEDECSENGLTCAE